MMRSNRHWLYFLGAVVVCLAVTTSVEAQCAKCYWPPPYNMPQCGNTYYNGANTCVINTAARTCDYLGSCQGDLGDECDRPAGCPVEQWACGAPLADEWRLETYTIERPAATKLGKEKA